MAFVPFAEASFPSEAAYRLAEAACPLAAASSPLEEGAACPSVAFAPLEAEAFVPLAEGASSP
jgi:hypothetical protein